MRRYNLALLPNEETQRIFQHLAQTYFRNYQNGYLLGNAALPHVTLCQLSAENDQEVISAFQSFTGKQNISLRVEKFHYRTGQAAHRGFFWAEFLVEKKPELLKMQKACHAYLIQKGFESLTPVENYSPHITLARVPQKPEEVCSIESPISLVSFRPTVGISTENGIFVREL